MQSSWSLCSAGRCQLERPPRRWKPALHRILAATTYWCVLYFCAKRFHKNAPHLARNWNCSTGSVEGLLLCVSRCRLKARGWDDALRSKAAISGNAEGTLCDKTEGRITRRYVASDATTVVGQGLWLGLRHRVSACFRGLSKIPCRNT